MTLTAVLFACGQLLRGTGDRRDRAGFLALFLGLYGLVKADELLLLSGAYVAAPHLGGIVYPVRMLLAPAFYAYVRAMTAPRPAGLRRSDCLAALGPLAFFALMSWFFFLPAQDKIGLVSLEYPDPELRDRAFLTCQLVFGVFLTVSVAYLAASLRRLARHAETLRSLFSNIEDRSLSWLRTASFVLLAGWVWYTIGEVAAVSGWRPGWYDGVTAWLEFLWIGGIAFAASGQPPAKAVASPPPSEGRPYAKAELSAERMVRIARRMDAAMTAEALSNDPALSLGALSDRTGVPQGQISQTLSRHLGTNFFDYVNGRRIEEAQRRLRQTDESVLEIAYGVGFNARSTFNAAFKRHTGQTPSAFRSRAAAREHAAIQPAA
ncbi:helix-turn-helix domain-containing protein [Parvularcula dongshanensis]|nr:helix-turn-helix transcriptional regulator [Parvularcula dongshanensis]